MSPRITSVLFKFRTSHTSSSSIIERPHVKDEVCPSSLESRPWTSGSPFILPVSFSVQLSKHQPRNPRSTVTVPLEHASLSRSRGGKERPSSVLSRGRRCVLRLVPIQPLFASPGRSSRGDRSRCAISTRRRLVKRRAPDFELLLAPRLASYVAEENRPSLPT